MKYKIGAWLDGFVDGWEQPYELTSGRSYDQEDLDMYYDRGANWGQFLRSPFNHQKQDDEL